MSHFEDDLSCSGPEMERHGAAGVESHPQYAAAFETSGFAASTIPVAFPFLYCSSSSAKRFNIVSMTLLPFADIRKSFELLRS